MINLIKNTLRDIKDIQKVKTVQTALLAKGYGIGVLTLENKIETHVKLNDDETVEEIIEIFVTAIELAKKEES